MLIQKALEFKEDTHEYFLFGEKVPSVTQIMKPLVDYSHVPEDILEAARQRGVDVHKICHWYFKKTLDFGSVKGAYQMYLQAFMKFLQENYKKLKLDRCISEGVLGHLIKKFAGTFDIYSPGTCLIDIKTRKYQWYDDIQVAGYEVLIKAHFQELFPLPKFILELRGNGTYRLIPCKDKQAERKFLSLFAHYKKNKKFYEDIKKWKPV